METNLTVTTLEQASGKPESASSHSDSHPERRVDGPKTVRKLRPALNPFDKLIATLMLLPGLPIILMTAALVKLTSRGPVFYSQRRAGRDGQLFYIHKIRTMTWNCESLTGAVWAAKNDPRVTTIGRFLRATHLDEFPQLLNVLDGEMAMVGPRPERPEIIERLLPEVPGYLDRLVVLPGVTGLAQVCTGADQTIDDVRLKLAFDRLYIQRKSTWLDCRIMLCTALKMMHLNFRWVRRTLLPESRQVIQSVESGLAESLSGEPHAEQNSSSELHLRQNCVTTDSV